MTEDVKPNLTNLIVNMPEDVKPNLTNLIVNYLPQSLTDEEFHQMFAAVGEVKASKIVRHHSTNYSYGYGFVEFTTPEDAQSAIDSLNGLPIQHKTIKVALARPPGTGNKNHNLYVQGIPESMNNEALAEIFRPYGSIVNARVLLKTDLTVKGDGFVLFETEESAQSALDDLDGQILPGGNRPMSVKFAMENKRQTQGQGAAGGKYPPPPPPAGRGGRGGGGFGSGGGPMRNRGGQQQQNRFNPMQQRGRGAGGGGGFRGRGGGNWRGGQNNGANNGFGGEQSYYGGDDYGEAFGAGGYDESYTGFDQSGYEAQGGYDQSYDQGFGAGDNYYDGGQVAGQGSDYPENGYQGYYDAMSYQGYQMPGQQRGRGRGGNGRGGNGRGGRGNRGGGGAPRGRGAGPRGGGRGGGAGAANYSSPGEEGIALYVYNIGPNATKEDLMTIFAHYGSVVKVDIIMDYEKNVTKNFAFVHMSTEEEAQVAISSLNERYCMRPNHALQVRHHEPKGKKPQQQQ